MIRKENRKPKIVSLALAIIVTTLITSGCGGGKAPAEANLSLEGALKSLTTQNYAGFISAVVPEQQNKVLTIEQWPYLQHVRKFKIDNEFDMNVTDNSANIMTELNFTDDEEVFATLYFALRKVDQGWYIDLDETVRMEIAKNGVNAFQAWSIEIK